MNCVAVAETHMKPDVFVHVIIAAEYLLTEDLYFRIRCAWCIVCIPHSSYSSPSLNLFLFLSKLTDLPFNFNQKKIFRVYLVLFSLVPKEEHTWPDI